MSLPDFKALFSNDFVDSGHAREKPKRIPVAEAWLSHPKRRQYEGVLLAPNGGYSWLLQPLVRVCSSPMQGFMGPNAPTHPQHLV